MRRSSRLYGIAITFPFVIFLATLFLAPGMFQDSQNSVFDIYQRLQPRVWNPDGPVRIIDIDDESLRRVGQWPWPRSKIAEMLEKLGELEASAVGFDIIFAEPDRMNPENFARSLPDGDLKRKLLEVPTELVSHDVRLASAMSKVPTVMGVILSQTGTTEKIPQRFGFVSAGDDPVQFLMRFPGAQRPLPLFEAAAAGLGALNWLPQRDQVVRLVPAFMLAGETPLPSLAAEVLRVAQGASTFVVRASNASGEGAFGLKTGINAIRIGAVEVATGAVGDLRVRYSRTQPGRFIPAWKLLSGAVSREDIEGRMILLGTSAAGLVDLRATPVDAAVPGVEIHAQIIESFVTNVGLVRPDWAYGAEIMLAMVLGLLVAFTLARIRPVAGAVLHLGLVGGTFLIGWIAFSWSGVLLNPLPPAALVALVSLTGTIYLFREAQLQRKQVRAAFGRFVSPAVVERIAEAPDTLVLGGETRVITLMFCDLRDFTAMSEGLDAQGITRFMNAYLTPLTDEILAHGGTVDKYIGDAIMAFWNAPLDDRDHARNAARAALAMVQALAIFNAQRQKEAIGEPSRPARFGIGLATGACSVGNIGSIRRFDYSAIGDPVNLASRLESITKFYGACVLATEETRDLAPDFAWLKLDQVRVKGRQGDTALFALVGDESFAKSPAFEELAAAHMAFEVAYTQGALPAAETAALKITALHHPLVEDPGVYVTAMLGRLSKWHDDPGGVPWNPIRVFDTK